MPPESPPAFEESSIEEGAYRSREPWRQALEEAAGGRRLTDRDMFQNQLTAAPTGGGMFSRLTDPIARNELTATPTGGGIFRRTDQDLTQGYFPNQPFLPFQNELTASPTGERVFREVEETFTPEPSLQNLQAGGYVDRGTMAGELGRRGDLSVRQAGETMFERMKRLRGYADGDLVEGENLWEKRQREAQAMSDPQLVKSVAGSDVARASGFAPRTDVGAKQRGSEYDLRVGRQHQLTDLVTQGWPGSGADPVHTDPMMRTQYFNEAVKEVMALDQFGNPVYTPEEQDRLIKRLQNAYLEARSAQRGDSPYAQGGAVTSYAHGGYANGYSTPRGTVTGELAKRHQDQDWYNRMGGGLGSLGLRRGVA